MAPIVPLNMYLYKIYSVYLAGLMEPGLDKDRTTMSLLAADKNAGIILFVVSVFSTTDLRVFFYGHLPIYVFVDSVSTAYLSVTLNGQKYFIIQYMFTLTYHICIGWFAAMAAWIQADKELQIFFQQQEQK